MISQWIPWASAASEDASPVSVPPAISLELAGRCCFSWLIGTVLCGATCSTARNPSSTAPSAGAWPPSCCACCGWGVRQTTCTCGRKHAAYCSIQAHHGTHAHHPILKKDEKGWKPNISKSPTYSLFQYYPIFTCIYHMLPPVLVVYLWFLHG